MQSAPSERIALIESDILTHSAQRILFLADNQSMAQPLSIEREDWTYLITTRTAGSRLWFIHNPELEQRILGCLARYQEIYQVDIYAFILMGNHYHLVARFSHRNRALFMRDFNSAVARLVGRYAKQHGRRSVWARRYSYQILPTPEDVLQWFFYTALNPVFSGLVPRIEEHSGFNSFFDAVSGRERTYKWLDWNAYFKAKRHGRLVLEEEYTKTYCLCFSRLPGFEDASEEEYRKHLKTELNERRKVIIYERRKAGKGFLGKTKLQKQVVGSVPYSTKCSSRNSYRPLVLSLSLEAKRATLSIYFSILEAFRVVSEQYLSSHLRELPFPPGTYPPPCLACCS